MPALTRPSRAAVDACRRTLAAALGPSKLVDDPDLFAPYASDWSFAAPSAPDLVVRAETTADIQAVLRAATTHGVPVTPRGLGTGKSGGAIPVHGGIVLSLERMSRMKDVSRTDMIAVAEPGIVTQAFMDHVEAEGLFYPPDPNSLKICSLGGNVACNAGGPRALKYGVTKNYVLGVEVVIPSGEVLRFGRGTLKHAAGYDLTALMIGSEGTLGVITEITTRLIPLPRAVTTALVTFSDLGRAGEAITAISSAGVVPRTLEFLDDYALGALREKTPGRFPENAGALLILETDGTSVERSMEELERAASVCLEHGALDVLVAQDAAQREKMWEPRRTLSVTLSETAPRKISEDIVVPRSQIPTMLAEAKKIGERHRVGLATYGHAGDGNLHVNILFDDEAQARADQAVHELMSAAVALGGTISGEHGVGLTKREFLPLEHSAPLIELQRQLKRTFDPAGILNPGKIFPSRGPRE